jgi:transposase
MIRAMPNAFYKTGACRRQSLLLPARIEDYVGRDNAVRAIAAYVDTLDLAKLKFRHSERAIGAGQPPYDPADLLKLYLYGYLNQIRSSRRLEREAGRNIELIWLLGGLVPGYRTIGKFRSDNVAPLKQANRDFVLLLRSLDLVGGELVAIDGAFFDGNASKASIVTRKRLDAQLTTLDCEIAAYTATLDANDAAEAAEPAAKPGADLAGKLTALLAKRAAAAADVATLEASGQTQLSRTDPDARRLSKNGQSVSGYNVQIAVDAKHKLIVACEAVNDGNDTGQLHAMAQAACAAVGADKLQAVADCGYFNGETLKACEDSGIEAFVPEPRRGRQPGKDGRFGLEAFGYDAAADIYRCPAGEMLRPMAGRKRDVTGKWRIRYVSRRSACATCPLRGKCLSAKADRRIIERWEHEDVSERHRARMATSEDMMRRRKALAEHPFGTLKCRAGYRHFLMRGFDKVRGELGLMILCYNFTRVLTIIGLDRLVAWLATRCFLCAMSLLATVRAPVGGRRSGLCRKASGFSTIRAAPLSGRTKAWAATGFAT